MPRNVRNFWIELNIDGRKSRIATGPVSKDGGFSATIYMRDAGCVERAMVIRGQARPDGLALQAWVPAGITCVVDNDGPIEIYSQR